MSLVAALYPPRPSGVSAPGVAWLVALSLASAAWSVSARESRRFRRPSPANTLLVGSVAFAHFVLLYLTLAWAFVLPPAADWLLVAYSLLRMGSYLAPGVNGECVVNLAEKKLMDPAYRMGSAPHDEPYQQGLPLIVQAVISLALLTLAPYMIFVTFSAAGVRRMPPPLWRVLLAAAVALHALHGFWGFAAPKLRAAAAQATW